ncbi:MAG: hypothetical protein ACXQTP_00950 [Candidatus Methanofastidiosia archaeon]
MNKKRMASLFVLSAMLVSMAAFVTAEEATTVKVVIDAAHETRHPDDLLDLPAKLEGWGYTVEMVTDEITADVLADAKILLTPVPQGIPYSQEELDAIKAWFDGGNVAIWVAGDSDYDGPEIIPNTNVLLSTIGSHIMLENASIEEPDIEYNDGSAYRVVVSNWNADISISTGVSKEVFHGPTFLYGIKDGNPVNLATTDIKNVTWVAKTSENAVVVIHHLTSLMTPGLEDGSTGQFVMMAAEEKAGAKNSSKIVVTTEANFCAYKNMNMDGSSEKGNHEIQGETLLKNTLDWLKAESEGGGTNMYLYVGVAVIVIIVLAAVLMKKK